MKYYFSIVALAFLAACGGEKEQKQTAEAPKKIVNVPAFNADSAYYFVQKQVDFGPRIPNTPAHKKTSDYFVSQFKKYGATVITQEFTALSFDNQSLRLKNIIASFGPDKKKRILLASHWDTRPFADKDSEKPRATFDGANDGASGVGVLLEIARVLKTQAPDVGVDLILFDGEDWGEKESGQARIKLPSGYTEWWCLGSQYWARNKHKKNYSASYGILIDMVGGRRSQFFRDGVSMEYAPKIVDKVWTIAHSLGYSDYFVKQNVPAITDDHLFINRLAKIPMIDIVPYRSGLGFFGDFHHTRNDNMSLISKETLAVVGTTLLHVIYSEEK